MVYDVFASLLFEAWGFVQDSPDMVGRGKCQPLLGEQGVHCHQMPETWAPDDVRLAEWTHAARGEADACGGGLLKPEHR